jgi:hypothetical protein
MKNKTAKKKPAPEIVKGERLPATCEDWGFWDPAITNLCKKAKGDLTEDEVLVLAIAAGQAALAQFVHPEGTDAKQTLDRLLAILDHHTIVKATRDKARELLAARQAPENHAEAKIAPAPAALTHVLEALYDSEINASVSIASFWDCGWHWKIKLGDELNGFRAEKVFSAQELQTEAASWLIDTAIQKYPDSAFAKTFTLDKPDARRKLTSENV